MRIYVMYCENTSLHSMNFLSFSSSLHQNQIKAISSLSFISIWEEIKKKRENVGEAPRRLRISPPRVQVWTPHGYEPVSLKGPRLKHLRGPQIFSYYCACVCVCVCVCKAYIIHTNITKYRTTRLELYKPNNQGNYKETSSQSTQRAPTSLI